MFKKIKEFFTGKPAAVEAVAEAPYKVETVVAPVVAEVAPVVAEVAPEVAVPAKKTAAKKPAAMKAKKPRKPKAPK